MEKAKTVIYIDPKGFEHEALVTAINGLHPGRVSLVMVDDKAEERFNTTQVYDVPHMSDPSKQEVRTVLASDQEKSRGMEIVEGNAHLPSYTVNCWKERGEEHRALPSDHPQFDHPFMENKFDEHSVHQPKARPETEKDILAHLTGPVDQADGATELPAESEMTTKLLALLTDQKAALDSAAASREQDAMLIQSLHESNLQLGVAVDQGSLALFEKDAEIRRLKAQVSTPAAPPTETKNYSDGSSATGPAPLPDQSPAQQDAANKAADAPSS